ncbi:MAG: hypothetical protein V4850_26620 [Myxococcota bacterium]
MSRTWTLAAIAFAFVCAFAGTYPAAAMPADTILCNFVHPDCLSNHWLMVWVAEQVRDGGSILHNDRYYWPVGDAPWLAGNGSEGFAYLPFHLLWGWPKGATIYLVAILTLNGIAGYALARGAGASRAASLTAVPSSAVMLYAIHELGAGRFSQVSFCWMAFFLAAWLHLLRTSRVGKPSFPIAVGAAVLLALTSLFYWYYGLFAVLAGGVLLLGHVVGAPKESRPDLRALVVFSVTFLALVAPLLWVFLRYWSSIPGTGEEVFPHPEAVGDSTWPGIPFLVNSGRHAGRALPFTVVILAFVALFDKERRRVVLSLWAVALLFAALMAGALIPNGPFEWIYGLAGPLRRFWWPYRHVIVMNLALVTLAVLGAQLILRRPWLLALLALSVPAQLTVQGAPWRAQFSKADLSDSFYPLLRDLPGTVLVEPPLAPGVASAQTTLVYQLLHGKTLLAGHAMWVDRVRPDAWDTYVAANSFLTELQRLDRAELATTFTFREADLAALIDAGARTYVVNQEYFPLTLRPLVNVYDALFTTLFGKPVATGKRVKAWDASAWKPSAPDGVAVVPITTFEWPRALHLGGPTLSLQAPRPPSIVFSVPPPLAGEKRPPPKNAGEGRK